MLSALFPRSNDDDRTLLRNRGRLSVRWASMGLLAALSVAASFGSAPEALAHGPIPPSLKGVATPEVPGLLSGRDRVIRNRRYATVLGKALFWDIQVGSDGVACASCHHQAGADGRAKNQLSPGHAPETRPTAATFQPAGSGAAGGPNYALRASDFPLHKLADPDDFSSAVQFTTDDVVGSAGALRGVFQGSRPDSPIEDCDRSADAVFHVQGVATRQVTSRNAPSVFNTVFQRRSFWDGRANTRFNGVNALGDRDAAAGVWSWRKKQLEFVQLALTNSALASQAVEPPVDTTEMSCSQRSFADIGRKLLSRRALEFQAVHAKDSVLGRYRDRSGLGLKLSYLKLIRKTFDKRYWAALAADGQGAFGSPAGGGDPYTQAEANFAMFFGLAIQVYESTLNSDDAPYDSVRDGLGLPTALNEQQRSGLTAFMNFHCGDCHVGPTLSGAVNAEAVMVTEVDRKPIRTAAGAQVVGLTDKGFVNTGVVPQDHDAGVGAADPLGRPLSLTSQYLEWLQGTPDAVVDPMVTRTCAMTAPFAVASFGQPAFAPNELVADPAGTLGCFSSQYALAPTAAVVASELALPAHGRLPDGTPGAFKIPSLRNIELTGPYMHNGSMATLEEVVEFYNRGGNFTSQGKDAQFLFSNGMSAQTKADLVAFLKTLTDERVRWEKAPFDHPALPLPIGHVGDENAVTGSADAGFSGTAETQFVELPAVGAAGRELADGPRPSFAERLLP